MSSSVNTVSTLISPPQGTLPCMAKRRTRGDGTVYKDEKRGRWVGQIWIDGKRRKVYAPTKGEASAKLATLRTADPAERNADRSITLATHLNDWYRTALPPKELAPSTMATHQWAVSVWSEALGSRRVANLRADDIDTTLSALGDDYSKASLVKLRSTLNQALKWGVRRRTVAYNAADAAELPAEAKEGHSKRALTMDELEALEAAAAEHPLGAMFMLSARAGLRPGEAAAVTRSAIHIDSAPAVVDVVQAVTLNRGAPSITADLKTKGAVRSVTIGQRLADALSAHLNTAGDGLLFTDSNGGPVHPSTARKALRSLCDAAGIAPVTPNELRHTFATLLAAKGTPPHELADLLGHRTTRMVEAVYRHRPSVRSGAELL